VALTIDDDARILDGGIPLKFLRDAEYDWAPPLVAFDYDTDPDAPTQVLLRTTPDGKLKVDTEISFDGEVKIGAVEIEDRNSSTRLDIIKIGDASTPTDANQGILSMGLDDKDKIQALPMLDLGDDGFSVATTPMFHGKMYSTPEAGTTITGAVANREFDFGFMMSDVDFQCDADVEVSFGEAAGVPDSGSVSLPAGRHFFDNQNSRYMFVTTTETTVIDVFANGGVS